jgi:hypothetical protein
MLSILLFVCILHEYFLFVCLVITKGNILKIKCFV